MLLYIDSLFGEARDRDVRPLHTVPETLCGLYLIAMREHKREAVLVHRAESGWSATPDWRFDRHVIRFGLYLRERIGIGPGDRVAIVSELRPEWPLADFAVVSLGAVAMAAEPGLSADELVAALADTAPKALIVSGRDVLGKLEAALGRIPDIQTIIAFDDDAALSDDVKPLSSILDLGGTLDTPELAQSFRAQARRVSADQPALRHYERSADGSVRALSLTHAEAIDRLKPFWFGQAAREGDKTYLVGPVVTLEARLALQAFIGDGHTTTVLGTPAREPDELCEHRPDKIVAPPEVVERTATSRPADGRRQARGVRDWIQRLASLTPAGRARKEREEIRESLGGHARWIVPTGELDPALAARLSTVADVGLNRH